VTQSPIHAVIAKYLWTISFLLGTVFLIFSVCSAGQFKVSRVTDGDTITVRDGSVEKIIRLVGIDAPEVSHKKRETGQPFSQQPPAGAFALAPEFTELDRLSNGVVDLIEEGRLRFASCLPLQGSVSLQVFNHAHRMWKLP